jgi:hypothetical protein
MIKILNKRLVFDIKLNPRFERYSSHAKGPNPIQIGDYIRVYFSSNLTDSEGVTSRINYVDFDLQFKSVISYSEDECIDLGRPGTFDEHGIFPFKPFYYKNDIYAFTTGWSRRVSVDVDTSIGLAKSSFPFKKFNKFGSGPLISANYKEPFLLLDPCLLCVNDEIYIYYCFGNEYEFCEKTGENARSYLISYAKTSDLFHWDRTSRYIIEKNTPNEVQAYPSVIYKNSKFHMLFCYRDRFDFRLNSTNSYRIGYAYSTDGRIWERNDDLLVDLEPEFDYDAEMKAYPSIIEVEDRIYLLYNGNSFGRNGFIVADLAIEEVN